MKSLDPKSLIIGVLSGIVLLTSLGGTKKQNENFGDITVSSLTVENEYGKKVVELEPGTGGGVDLILLDDGEEVVSLGANEGMGGLLLLDDGQRVAGLTSSKEAGGRLGLYNHNGDRMVTLRTYERGGWLRLSNKNKNRVVALRTNKKQGGELRLYNKYKENVAVVQSNEKQEGTIGLFDKYGDIKWIK